MACKLRCTQSLRHVCNDTLDRILFRACVLFESLWAHSTLLFISSGWAFPVVVKNFDPANSHQTHYWIWNGSIDPRNLPHKCNFFWLTLLLIVGVNMSFWQCSDNGRTWQLNRLQLCVVIAYKLISTWLLSVWSLAATATYLSLGDFCATLLTIIYYAWKQFWKLVTRRSDNQVTSKPIHAVDEWRPPSPGRPL